MQSFAHVVHSLLVSIRALESRRSQLERTPADARPPAPVSSLGVYLPYRCEPTGWGEDVSPSTMDSRTPR